MKFGILRDDVEGNYDEEGYPLFEEFIYVENLDLTKYHDVTTVSYMDEHYEEANMDENTMQTAVKGIINDYSNEEDWNFDEGLRDWEKEWLTEEDWFNPWEYDETMYGNISFTSDKELTIYQESEINFDFTNGESFGLPKPGATMTVRLYCNGANVKINGLELDKVNKQYIEGNTHFVIIQNTGVFQLGHINFLSFKYLIIDDAVGVSRDEIRVTINSVQEHAVGVDSGLTDWVSGKYYDIGDDVIGPGNRFYNCISPHTSDIIFDESKWEREGGIDQTDVDDFEAILFGSGSNDS